MSRSPQPRNQSRTGVEIRVTPRGVHQVRIFSQEKREDGFEFYRRLLPVIESLDNIARKN